MQMQREHTLSQHHAGLPTNYHFSHYRQDTYVGLWIRFHPFWQLLRKHVHFLRQASPHCISWSKWTRCNNKYSGIWKINCSKFSCISTVRMEPGYVASFSELMRNQYIVPFIDTCFQLMGLCPIQPIGFQDPVIDEYILHWLDTPWYWLLA